MQFRLYRVADRTGSDAAETSNSPLLSFGILDVIYAYAHKNTLRRCILKIQKVEFWLPWRQLMSEDLQPSPAALALTDIHLKDPLNYPRGNTNGS
jgi:hypothetical protein